MNINFPFQNADNWFLCFVLVFFLLLLNVQDGENFVVAEMCFEPLILSIGV